MDEQASRAMREWPERLKDPALVLQILRAIFHGAKHHILVEEYAPLSYDEHGHHEYELRFK